VNVVNPLTFANRAIARQHRSRHATGRCNRRGIWQQRRALARSLALAALLAGCGSGASPPAPASPADYPDLASVPARPNLSYTVEQRQAIGDALVADRANARYRQAELAYATGRSSTPPPAPPAPPPPEPAAGPDPPAAPPPGAGPIARGYVDAVLNAAADEGKLRHFMRRLERPIPDPYGPRTVTQAVGLAPRPDAAAQEDALDGFGSFLGGVLGLEGADAEEGAGPR
jgi:hypothetical protein